MVRQWCTIPYCTSATKVGVCYFHPEFGRSFSLPERPSSNSWFSSIRDHPLSTSSLWPRHKTALITCHGKTTLMCISVSTKANSERERERERMCVNSIKNAKNAPCIFSCTNSVFVNKNNNEILKLKPKRIGSFYSEIIQ